MKFLQLQFRARLDGTRDNLPPFLGATLRGAFGYVLKETVCQVRNTPCPACYLKTACPYVSLFEGLAPDDREILRKYPNIPQPFVLVVPLQREAGGDPACLEWGIRLFGKAVHHWPHVLHTFHQIGQRGLGKKQIPYEIQEVRDELSDQVIWTHDEGSIAEPVVEITREGQMTASEQDVSTIKWRFESPVKLRKQGRVDALTIILAGQRRFKILDHFYGGQRHGESKIESDWVRAEEFVTEESRLRPFRFSRFSGRQQQRMQLSGLVGEITITGPWHKTGEWLNHISRIHLGKSTSFGFGNVTWEQQ